MKGIRQRAEDRQSTGGHQRAGLRRTRLGWWGVLVVALVVGCEQPQDRAGTNTNWLRVCVEDADCSGAYACVCGRCTVPCVTDADCEGVGVCSTRETALLQCAGEITRSCQRECTSDGDCADERLCHFGACADPIIPGSCAADALVCEDFEGPFDYEEVVTEGNSLTPIEGSTPSGQVALQTIVTAGPSVAHLDARWPALSTGTLHLRGWVRIPQAEEGYDISPFALVSTIDTSWSLRLVLKSSRLEVWSYTTPMSPSADLVPGEWHCIQTDVVIGDAPEGSVTVSVNGEVVGTATEVDTLPDGGIEGLEMGGVWSGEATTIEIDRVHLGPTPLGCWD